MRFTSYHNSENNQLTAIKAGEGRFGGIFVVDGACHTRRSDYGQWVYEVKYNSICSKQDIEDFLYSDDGIVFLEENNRTEEDIRFLSDCDDAAEDDDNYFENQRLRALICIKLGFDAVEENDGWLVVNGLVRFVGHCKGEEIAAIDEDE